MTFIFACWLLSPLRILGRNKLLERILDIEFTEVEFSRIQEVCANDGRKLGDFYYWKAVNAMLLVWMKRLGSKGIRHLISMLEIGDSGFPILDKDRGAIFAIPHYGHFVMSIIAIASSLSDDREVYLFYEAPEHHASNVLFDVLHDKIFRAECMNVHVVNNNRNGLGTALKALANGAALIILPDVYRDVRDTFIVPFLGRQQHVMLGAATLARKTGATVYPVVSMPDRNLYHFRTHVGSPLDVTAAPGDLRESSNQYLDYQVTFRMFKWFEERIGSDILWWQYASKLFGQEAFPLYDEQSIIRNEELLLSDPRCNVDTTGAIRLFEIQSQT